MKKALVIIDVQNTLVDEGPYKFDQLTSNINKVSQVCRDKGIEVIYVQHCNDEEGLKPHTEGWQVHESIAPQEGEVSFLKRHNSAFKETGLDTYLKEKGITSLIMMGMQTEYCVDTSVKVGFELGYDLYIPEGGTSTFDNGYLRAEQIVNQYENMIYGGFGHVLSIDALLDILKEA